VNIVQVLIHLNNANSKQKKCMLRDERKNKPGNGREEAAATLFVCFKYFPADPFAANNNQRSKDSLVPP
jgi:hypothetical protein